MSPFIWAEVAPFTSPQCLRMRPAIASSLCSSILRIADARERLRNRVGSALAHREDERAAADLGDLLHQLSRQAGDRAALERFLETDHQKTRRGLIGSGAEEFEAGAIVLLRAGEG